MSDRDYVLELFVADHNIRTKQLAASITDALERLVPGRYRLSTINVLDDPARAEAARVFATPMLIKSLPSPSLRVLGDLSNTNKVMELLEIGDRADA